MFNVQNKSKIQQNFLLLVELGPSAFPAKFSVLDIGHVDKEYWLVEKMGFSW